MEYLKLLKKQRKTCVKIETNQNLESLLEIFQLSRGRGPKRIEIFLNQEFCDKNKSSDWELDGRNQAFSHGENSV